MKMKNTYVRYLVGLMLTASMFIFLTVMAFSPGHSYQISGSPTVSGYHVSLVGTASADTYVGSYSDQKISVDWEDDGIRDLTLQVDAL